MKPTYVNDSLLITPELCKSRKGCEQGMAYMKESHPNGFTVDDVYTKKVRHIPMHFVCWGYHFLPFTEEDKRKFIEYAKIVRSTRWCVSHHITDCDIITDSSYCSYANRIYFSQNVSDATEVDHSSFIEGSAYISHCTEVYQSDFCGFSNNIIDSQYVLRSNSIRGSYGIVDSENILNSLYIEKSRNVTNCILSIGDGIENRIFCDENCPAADYAILNKKVSKQKFDFLFERLAEILREEPFVTADDDFFHSHATLLYRTRCFNKFSEQVSELLGHIDDSDRALLFKLTLANKFLPNKI